MTGLEITIKGSQEYIANAVQMEDNYPGIHRKAIWEQAVFPARLLSQIASLIQQPFLEKKHKKLVESFKEKRDNPENIHYIDKFVLNKGIKVRYNTVPIRPERYDKQSKLMLGDLASSGICFETAPNTKDGNMNYTITHGNA